MYLTIIISAHEEAFCQGDVNHKALCGLGHPGGGQGRLGEGGVLGAERLGRANDLVCPADTYNARKASVRSLLRGEEGTERSTQRAA